jgi:hypothetical protein
VRLSDLADVHAGPYAWFGVLTTTLVEGSQALQGNGGSVRQNLMTHTGRRERLSLLGVSGCVTAAQILNGNAELLADLTSSG